MGSWEWADLLLTRAALETQEGLVMVFFAREKRSLLDDVTAYS
jgi:hypothetical protein